MRAVWNLMELRGDVVVVARSEFEFFTFSLSGIRVTKSSGLDDILLVRRTCDSVLGIFDDRRPVVVIGFALATTQVWFKNPKNHDFK